MVAEGARSAHPDSSQARPGADSRPKPQDQANRLDPEHAHGKREQGVAAVNITASTERAAGHQHPNTVGPESGAAALQRCNNVTATEQTAATAKPTSLRVPVTGVRSQKRVTFEQDSAHSLKPQIQPDRLQEKFSDLLQIQPEQAVHFSKFHSAASVKLKNVSKSCVAFKFKASSPACLARPMSGTLGPGEIRDVQVSLGALLAVGGQAVREKYLVLAMAVQSPAALGRDEWAAVDKGAVRELRLAAVREAA